MGIFVIVVSYTYIVLPLLNNLIIPAKALFLNGFCKYRHRLFFYFISTFPLQILYRSSTNRINVFYSAIGHHISYRQRFNKVLLTKIGGNFGGNIIRN